MGDYFTFAVGLPQMDLDGAPEGGSRYPGIASLAGRVFTKFHLDVGIGDAIVRPTEIVRGRDWLEFAGIPRALTPSRPAPTKTYRSIGKPPSHPLKPS